MDVTRTGPVYATCRADPEISGPMQNLKYGPFQ
jgi:hypothetical protein